MYIFVYIFTSIVTPLPPCNINIMYIEPCVSVYVLGVDSVPQVVSD